MNRFAALLDRLAYEPRRNAKIRLMADYFHETPDPERGMALAALTGALSFRHAKPNIVRTLIGERTDPTLFQMSRDYVGDMAETVALMWPAKAGVNYVPTLTEIVEGLHDASKLDLPNRLAHWLDALDETGRWALLKLITGSLRIGASARLAKTAVASLGDGIEPNDVELVWPGLLPPYEDLFAWVEGRGEKPENRNPAPFRPPMLSTAIEDTANWREVLNPDDFTAEWKWDGIRVQAVGGTDENGEHVARLYSRTGEEISTAFPDVIRAISFDGALDGELLIVKDGAVQSFNVLQQRLNRKTITPKLVNEYPAQIRAYDLLVEKGEDLRSLTFDERRARLEAFIARQANPAFTLSPQIAFSSWDDLTEARAEPALHGADIDAEAVEGVMVKKRSSVYVPGRPKGEWFKWKRDPFNVDAVLMYAQRGSGKRSSFYSDYTFGVWAPGEDGEELVPVGKAYFGFTDEELLELDKFVRKNTINRFGPVREVTHEPDEGLVLEVAFEGLSRSTRHKSGVAMRFPRISRIRWDKPPREADRIEHLEALLG
jgi:DNA ligase-1